MRDVWRLLNAGETIQEQRALLYEYLERDGIKPPALSTGVDESERNQVINAIHQHWWTVRYTTLDAKERKVYYFEEREVWHIIPRLLEKGDDCVIPYLSRVPRILRTGDVYEDRYDPALRLYRSQHKVHFREVGEAGYLEVAVKEGNVDFVLTFYVRWTR